MSLPPSTHTYSHTCRDVTVELDGVADDEALDLPRVAKGEPVVGLLVLKPVDDALMEGGEQCEEKTHKTQHAPYTPTWRNMPYE